MVFDCRLQHGNNGRHDAATAATNAATTGAVATATAFATPATTTGVQSATVAHVSSHYATKPDDECARTDAKYSHEPVSEHVDATGRHGYGPPGQPHAERAHAGTGTHASAEQHATELHDVAERAHAKPERKRLAAFVPVAPQHVFLHRTNHRLQP